MISCVSGTVRGRFQLLQRLVSSVRSSVGTLPYEIVLIACDCEPSTVQWIRSQEDCVLLEMPAKGAVPAFNLGFSKVRAGRNDYVQILNDDVAVDRDSIRRAAAFLDSNPDVGQVAFFHKYQNRGPKQKEGVVQRMLGGYVYGQCSMVRKWLGDYVKWWGDYGLVQYGGDNHLSCGIWNLGYKVVPVRGCAVIDWECNDASRKKFSDGMRKAGGGVHPDTVKWMSHWKGKLPKRNDWTPARVNRIWSKASRGVLRTLRFKAMMGRGTEFQPRTALIDAFGAYGPSKQANQDWAVTSKGQKAAQGWFVKVAKEFDPDLIMLQAQRPNNILPGTVGELKKAVPKAFVFNWDADTHYPMQDFHWQIARACHLQLTISPDLFPWYHSHGAFNVGYWPIGVEREFIEVDRYKYFNERESNDVIFLGTLYGLGMFPEAGTRRDAVVKLFNAKPKIKFDLKGAGWGRVGIKVDHTLEDFDNNPIRYSRSKMALSISQTAEYWGYTSDRAYNILATGCPLLLQRFRGMDEHGLVDGETCIAWSSLEEMVSKVRYYLKHPKEREEIGRAGKEMLLARHTWDHRVEELFDLLAELGR